MEEKIKSFFEGAGKEAAEHLASSANILITIGETSYTLKITDEREVKVGKAGKQGSDVEIKGEEKEMNDLLSSSSLYEFSGKMRAHIANGKEPKVKILMERTTENSKEFLRSYYPFLRKIHILK